MIEFDCLEEWRTIYLPETAAYYYYIVAIIFRYTWRLDILQHLKWSFCRTSRSLEVLRRRFNYCRQVVQIQMLWCVRLSSETIWTITSFFVTLHLKIDHSLLSRDPDGRDFNISHFQNLCPTSLGDVEGSSPTTILGINSQTPR